MSSVIFSSFLNLRGKKNKIIMKNYFNEVIRARVLLYGTSYISYASSFLSKVPNAYRCFLKTETNEIPRRVFN